MDFDTNTSDTSNITLFKCPVEIPLMSWDSSSFNDAAKVSSILAIAVTTITMPLTVFLNALVIFVIWKNSSLQVEHMIFMAFLAFSDFLAGLTCQPIFIAREIFHLREDPSACTLDIPLFFFGFLLVGTSFYQIGIVTYERYVAIIHPFEYPTRITVQRLTYLNIGIWVVVVPAGILYILSFILNIPLYIDALDVFMRIVLTFLVVYWNAKVFAAIKRHNRQIKQQQQNVDINNPDRIQQNHKGAITAGLLLGCYLFPCIPLIIVLLFKQVFGFTLLTTPSLELSLQTWVFTFTHINSCINPIVYGLRMTELRNKCFKVLGLNDNSVVHIQDAPVNLEQSPEI